MPRALFIACVLLAGFCGEASAASFSSDPGSGTLTISGKIVPGDFASFEKEAKALASRKDIVVALYGPGGKMVEGLKIGVRIHEKGWSTRVDDGHVCLSTCAMMWLAGRERLASADAHIGFHAPFDDRTDKVSDLGIHVVGTYCDILGLGATTAKAIVEKTPGMGMTWVDAKQAEAMGVTMTVVPAKQSQKGHFSTAILDEQDQATAHFKVGGSKALNGDIDACYVAYRRRRVDEVGFRCFFLEGLAVSLVAKDAAKQGLPPDPHFSVKAAARRIARALLDTGHTAKRARALLASWQADIKATAKADP